MIFPFVDNLGNDRKMSLLLRYPGLEQFPGRKHQTPIIKYSPSLIHVFLKVFFSST